MIRRKGNPLLGGVGRTSVGLGDVGYQATCTVGHLVPGWAFRGPLRRGQTDLEAECLRVWAGGGDGVSLPWGGGGAGAGVSLEK